MNNSDKNNWFITDEKVEITQIKDIVSSKKTDNSPMFTNNKIKLVYKYTVEKQEIVKTEVEVKYES